MSSDAINFLWKGIVMVVSLRVNGDGERATAARRAWITCESGVLSPVFAAVHEAALSA